MVETRDFSWKNLFVTKWYMVKMWTITCTQAVWNTSNWIKWTWHRNEIHLHHQTTSCSKWIKWIRPRNEIHLLLQATSCSSLERLSNRRVSLASRPQFNLPFEGRLWLVLKKFRLTTYVYLPLTRCCLVMKFCTLYMKYQPVALLTQNKLKRVMSDERWWWLNWWRMCNWINFISTIYKWHFSLVENNLRLRKLAEIALNQRK